MQPEFQVGADGNSNRYDESICLYVKNRVGGIAEFTASVPLGTGAFCFFERSWFYGCGLVVVQITGRIQEEKLWQFY